MRSAALLLLLAGCTAGPSFSARLDVVVAEGQDPFAGADHVEVTVRYPDRDPITRTVPVGGEVEIAGFEPGLGAVVELTAVASDGTPVGLGRSLPFAFEDGDSAVAVFVGEADSLARFPGTLDGSRAWARAVSHPTGRVVIVGGGDNSSEVVEGVEFLGWDVTDPLGSLPGGTIPRIGHTLFSVPEGMGDWGGKVVVIGGTTRGFDDTLVSGWDYAVPGVTLIDPVSGEIDHDVVDLAGGYMDARAVWTTEQTIALIGGYRTGDDGTQYTSEVRIIDPTDGSDEAGPDLQQDDLREQHAAVRFEAQGNTFILTSGGIRGTSNIVVMESSTLWNGDPDDEVETLTGEGALSIPRARHTLSHLGGGQVLVAGGARDVDDFDAPGTVTGAIELFNVGTREYELLPAEDGLIVPRQRHVAVGIPDERVLLCGGQDAAGNPIGSCELFRLSTRSFEPFDGGSMAPGGPGVEAVPLPDGRVLFLGGASGLGPDDSLYVYTPPRWQD